MQKATNDRVILASSVRFWHIHTDISLEQGLKRFTPELATPLLPRVTRSIVDEALRNIGNRLREARESHHLTYREVSAATKIPVSTLEAIEHHDVAHLPQGIFMRGFVRTYAAEVGLDPAATDEALAQFHNEIPAEGVAQDDLVEEDEGRAKQISLLTVLMICLGFGIYITALRAPARSAPPPARDIVATSGKLDRVDATVPASASAEPAEGMRLQIHPRGACVVSATADGRSVVSRLVQPGETVKVEGQEELVLRITDPGACTYSIDGTSSRKRGQSEDAVIIRMAEEAPPQ